MRFNLGFFLAEAFKNIRLNLLMSITAVTTTFICILVFGVGLLVSEHVEGVIGSVREDVSVEVFMPGRGEEEVAARSEEHTSELQSRQYLVCRLLLEKKKKKNLTQKTNDATV